MRFIVIIGLVIFLMADTKAAGLEFLKHYGGLNPDEGYALCFDDTGNLYTVGSYWGTVDIEDSTFTTLTGVGEMFLAKYDPAGNLVYVRAYDSTFTARNIRDMKVDALGNIYILGFSVMAPGSCPVPGELYFGKFNNAGDCLWLKGGGGGNNLASAIAIDDDYNIYTAGYGYGTYHFGPFPVNTNGGRDAVLVKYDSTGQEKWLRIYGGTGDDNISGLLFANDGHLYITGHVKGCTDFGGSAYTQKGLSDAYLAKIDTGGNLIWVRSGGGTDSNYGYSIDEDGQGNIFIAGMYESEATFGSHTVAGSNKFFLAKYNADGDVLFANPIDASASWSGYSTNTGWLSGCNIRVSKSSGDIYLTVSSSGEANFGPHVVDAPGKAMYMAKYDNDGGVLMATQSKGGEFKCHRLAIDQNDKMAMTGYFKGTVYLHEDSMRSYNNSHTDFYVAKFNQEVFNSVPEAPAASPFRIFPNPASDRVHIQLKSGKPIARGEITLYNNLGVLVRRSATENFTEQLDIRHLAAGIYWLKLGTKDQASYHKIIKIAP